MRFRDNYERKPFTTQPPQSPSNSRNRGGRKIHPAAATRRSQSGWSCRNQALPSSKRNRPFGRLPKLVFDQSRCHGLHWSHTTVSPLACSSGVQGGGLPDKGKSRTLVNLSKVNQPAAIHQHTAMTTQSRRKPLAKFI
jgi:hypothetical protein